MTISIISLLSSVVLATLGNARNKAKDAVIKQELGELKKMADLSFSDSSSYSNVQGPGKIDGENCAYTDFGGSDNTTRQKAADLCNKIISLNSNTGASTAQVFIDTSTPSTQRFIFLATNAVSYSDHYSFMAWLPGAKTYACVGDSGNSSSSNSAWWGNGPSSGCYSYH